MHLSNLLNMNPLRLVTVYPLYPQPSSVWNKRSQGTAVEWMHLLKAFEKLLIYFWLHKVFIVVQGFLWLWQVGAALGGGVWVWHPAGFFGVTWAH